MGTIKHQLNVAAAEAKRELPGCLASEHAHELLYALGDASMKFGCTSNHDDNLAAVDAKDAVARYIAYLEALATPPSERTE